MENIGDFFHMGGYAGFVWPSWGAVALVLVVLFVMSRRALKNAEQDLEAMEAASPDQGRENGADSP